MPGAGLDPVSAEIRTLVAHLPPAVGQLLRGRVPVPEPIDDVARWAVSGAMALTGDPGGPPLAPSAPVASRLAAAQVVLAAVTAAAGQPVDVNVPALLGERAALRGLRRGGSTSAGGHARLLRAADGWVAVALPRADDWSLVPAWLHAGATDWSSVAALAAQEPAGALRARAVELGLAVAVVTAPADDAGRVRRPWRLHLTACGGARRRSPLRVVDLSALWAGPLCAHLLAEAGADVVTLEDPDRPDGARRGDPDLHRLLHGGGSIEPLALTSVAGRRRLGQLLRAADVVITAARPRALRHLDLDPMAHVAANPALTWVAITAYGLTGPAADAVGFGDDTAAGGGLLAGTGDAPMFCADAVADPCTGVLAAIAGLGTALAGGGVVDVALRDVAAHLARGPHRRSGRAAVQTQDGWVVHCDTGPVAVAPPRARVAAAA